MIRTVSESKLGGSNAKPDPNLRLLVPQQPTTPVIRLSLPDFLPLSLLDGRFLRPLCHRGFRPPWVWVGQDLMTRMLWLCCPGVAACPSVRTPVSTLRDVLHSALISTSGHLHSRQLFSCTFPYPCQHKHIFMFHLFACTIFFIVYPSNPSPGNIGQRLNMGESGRCFMPAKYLMLSSTTDTLCAPFN